MRRSNISQALTLKAAAAVRDQDEPEELMPVAREEPEALADANGARRGRPKGKRPVAARQTVYLDEARHAALVRLAEDRGRSVHSLIIEGIDHVVGKPTKAAWQ